MNENSEEKQFDEFLKIFLKHNFAISRNTIENYYIENYLKFDFDKVKQRMERKKFQFKLSPLSKNIFLSYRKTINDFHSELNEQTKNIPNPFIFFVDEFGYQFVPNAMNQFVKNESNKTLNVLSRECKLSNVCIALSADGSCLPMLSVVSKKQFIELSELKKESEKNKNDANQSNEIIQNRNQIGLIVHREELFYTKFEFIEWMENYVLTYIQQKKKELKYNGNCVIILNKYFEKYITFLLKKFK